MVQLVTMIDLLIVALIIWLIFISIILLDFIKNKEKNMNTVRKAKADMIDLEAITRNIEENYKPVNIELTSYEQEQENNAIISYEELLKNKNSNQINYDDEFENSTDISVKKVNLEKNVGTSVPPTKIEVNLMSYEKEEAFLKALKQLQNDLAR